MENNAERTDLVELLSDRFRETDGQPELTGLLQQSSTTPTASDQSTFTMSKLSHSRDKMYKTVARQLHGVVPCWVCGEHVLPTAATLEHIKPLSEGGNSHAENLAISHDLCNNQRHAKAPITSIDPVNSAQEAIN